jgi:hypothetical protein
MFNNSVLAERYDQSVAATFENLKAAGASKDVIERLQHVTRPSGGGPDPQNPEHVRLYNVLVLEALSELANKKSSASGASAARKSRTSSAAKKK